MLIKKQKGHSEKNNLNKIVQHNYSHTHKTKMLKPVVSNFYPLFNEWSA